MTVAWQALFGSDPITVDGGLSTQLAELGHDVSGPLWTGQVLLGDGDAVVRAHADFIAAGADVVISASYQVSRWGFEQAGLTRADADAALRASTRAARSAVEANPGTSAKVAASVGPYGAVLHDRSEYRGRYGLSHAQLVAFHRERLDVIAGTQPDLLAIETIPDADEAAALVDVLADHPMLPAWLSFSALDDRHVCAGQPIEEAVAIAASAPSVMAVGINCTDPRHVSGLVTRISAVSDLPIVVYPNSPVGRDVAGGPFGDDVVARWVALGAQAVGGCCGTDAEAIRQIAGLLARPEA